MKKLSWREGFLVVTPLLALLILALPQFHTRDRVDSFLSSTAGEQAVDCGTVPVGADRAAVDACTVRCYRAGQPFYARYDEVGGSARGMVMTPQKDFLFLRCRKKLWLWNKMSASADKPKVCHQHGAPRLEHPNDLHLATK